MSELIGQTNNPNGIGVLGESDRFEGIRGVSHATWHAGVVGINDNDNSDPNNPAGQGVYGTSKGTGVHGDSATWMGVYGNSKSTIGGAGVMGEGDPGPGVIGKSTAGIGVKAVSKDGVGLAAYTTSNEAIHAETKSPTTATIAAYNLNSNGTGAAIFAKKEGTQGHAGFFEGNVFVTGTLTAKELAGHIPAVEGLTGRLQALENRESGFENRLNTLQQQVNNLQQQLASLQQKQAADVQGIAISLATLAARVTALGG